MTLQVATTCRAQTGTTVAADPAAAVGGLQPAAIALLPSQDAITADWPETFMIVARPNT